MSIAYDVIGSFQETTSSSTLGGIAVSPTTGDTVVAFCAFTNSTAGTISATFGGSSMTQVGSTFSLGSVGGFAAYLAAFEISGVASGSQNVVFTTPTACVGMQGGADAYTGVGSVSATLASATGSTGALSLPSVSSATGHMVVNFCASMLGSGSIASYNQTSRGTNSALWRVLIGDAAGASTVSFSATVTAGRWGSLAVDLLPLLTGTANATITVGGSKSGALGYLGTANRSVTVTRSVANQNIFGTANGAITFSPTSSLIKGVRNTANRAVTFTPVATALQHGLSAVLTKLAANQNSTITVLGDSTSYGFGDTVVNPWVHGWVGRLAVLIGQYYNVNVSIASWNDQDDIAGLTGWPDAGATGQFYDTAYSIYTSSLGGSAATLLIIDGGACGKELTYLDNATRLPIMLATPADAIITATLINDYGVDTDSTSTYVSRYEQWLTDIQTLQPGVPITVTDENATNASYDSYLVSLATALWSALAGQPLTYNGTATNWSGVTLLNTRAAYNDLVNEVDALGVYGGAHPKAAGYIAQASYMGNYLAPGVVSNYTGTANQTITASRTLTGRCAVYQTANRSVSLGPTVHGGPRGTANSSFTVTTAVNDHFLGTANRAITVSRTLASRYAIFQGANRTAAFTRTVAGVDLDGASRSIAFGVSAAGHRGAQAGASIALTASAIASYNSHLLGSANTAIGWASSLWDGQNFVVSGSWPGVTGQVVFTEPGGAEITIPIINGSLNVALPVISGAYLVQFQELTAMAQGASIDPFAFTSPASGTVNLNSIVGPAPILHEQGSRLPL